MTPNAAPMPVLEFWLFEQRPEYEDQDFELVRGTPVRRGRTSRRHAVVVAAVCGQLGGYSERTGRGDVVAGRAGLILPTEPPSVFGPDVAVYGFEPEDELTGWSRTPPVLAVEVLDGPDDPTAAKAADYLLCGVGQVWLIDVAARQVLVHRPNRPVTLVGLDGFLDGGDELPGLRVDVADLFRLPSERKCPASASKSAASPPRPTPPSPSTAGPTPSG